MILIKIGEISSVPVVNWDKQKALLLMLDKLTKPGWRAKRNSTLRIIYFRLRKEIHSEHSRRTTIWTPRQHYFTNSVWRVLNYSISRGFSPRTSESQGGIWAATVWRCSLNGVRKLDEANELVENGYHSQTHFTSILPSLLFLAYNLVNQEGLRYRSGYHYQGRFKTHGSLFNMVP